jgi:hypothetical protein
MQLAHGDWLQPAALAELRERLAGRFGAAFSRAEIELGLGAMFWTMLIVFIVRSGE